MIPLIPLIAIDGPAGAGKSSVARRLAERLGFALVDTGGIYRAVALAAARRGITWTDDAGLALLLSTWRIEQRDGGLSIDGEDVSEAIRAPEISRGASTVSARPVVRDGLLELQRSLALQAKRGAVLEGRDIGTVVFPDAAVKFFVTASPEKRATRRYAELSSKGVTISYESVLADQIQRDREDSERAIAPLKPAPDAVIVDTTALTLEQVVNRLERVARDKLMGGVGDS